MKRAIAIVGPTGSGKTNLALLIADRLDCEIISADSRQIYRYLNIGTAKPTSEQLKRVTHHFIDILDPDQDYNAGMYGQSARKIMEDIFDRQKKPIICGGSGLYIRAVIDGLFEGPGKNPEVRKQLEEEMQKFGKECLFNKLKKIDPESASKMDPSKARRIVRALEVYYTTGESISSLHKVQQTNPSFEVVQFGLNWDRKLLYERINNRVDDMILHGLVDEITELKLKGYSQTINALNTVGYKEAFDFIEGGISRDEMIELIKRNTRRFAKRQLTWFCADKRINWIQLDSKTHWNEIADNILRKLYALEGKSPISNNI